MKGADIALGWVNDGDGKVHLYDMKAIGNSAPKMDTSQDLKLIKGYQNESHTVITFQRPWQTCDTEMVSKSFREKSKREMGGEPNVKISKHAIYR